jgi:hypothetical protein
MGTFFRCDGAELHDHPRMMLGDVETVNGRVTGLARSSSPRTAVAGRRYTTVSRNKRGEKRRAKKSRAQRARLEVLASEADTITFQEGLLSFRATGGGGQMRNA